MTPLSRWIQVLVVQHGPLYLSLTLQAAVARRTQTETQPAVHSQPQEAVGRAVHVISSRLRRLVASLLCPG